MKSKHDFRFISKHAPEVKAAYSDLIQLLSLVHDDLKHKYKFEHRVVGSYERDMITYDLKSNVGFDLDVNITPHDDDQKYSAKEIKLSFKRSLDMLSLFAYTNSLNIVSGDVTGGLPSPEYALYSLL